MRGVHLSRLTCCPGAGASKRCAHHWGTQAVTGATGVGTRDTTHGVTMGVHCPHHTYLVCVPEDSGRRLAQHPDGKWFGTASSRLLLYGQGSFCTRSPCPDVSIFSLKEIQLQKDPGYRGSAFQQSGRSGKMALTPLLDGTTGRAGTGVAPSGYPHKRKPNLLPALVYKLPLRHPHSSPVGT